MRSDSSECIGTWCGPLRSNSLVSYQNWRLLQCIQANTRNCFCAQSLYSSEVSQLSSNPDHPPFASPEQTESEVPLHCLGMSGAVVDGGHHLVPMRFHSHPVLTRKTASGSLVAQLHSLLSPCQTPLVTGQGLWPHMCVYPWTPSSSCCTLAVRLTHQHLALMGMRSAGRSRRRPRTSLQGRAVMVVTGFSEPKAQACLSSKLSTGCWLQEHLPLVYRWTLLGFSFCLRSSEPLLD